MYKFLCIAAFTVASVNAYSRYQNDAHADVLKQDLEIDEHHGSYKHGYATSNGIAAHETGVGGHYAEGSYSYYTPEGHLVQIKYTADEHGYQPKGAHLPTPPPIPTAILKSLEYNRKHPEKEEDEYYGASGSHHQQKHHVQQHHVQPQHNQQEPAHYQQYHQQQYHQQQQPKHHKQHQPYRASVLLHQSALHKSHHF